MNGRGLHGTLKLAATGTPHAVCWQLIDWCRRRAGTSTGSDQYVTSQVFPSHTKNTMLIRGPRMDDRFWTIHLAVYRELQSGQEPAGKCSMQSSSMVLESSGMAHQPQRAS